MIGGSVAHLVALSAVLMSMVACAPGQDEADQLSLPAESEADTSQLPLPTLHHVHINSIAPERSLAWYEKFWPAGRATTFAGFPAFADGAGRYLLYTQVDAQAPGAYDTALRRSVPQSAVWTVGPTMANTDAFYDRMVELYPDEFEFLPVYAGPDDTTGAPRSSLLAQGLQDFGYLVDPDGVFVEFNVGMEDDFFGHTHYWREAPLCSRNWYAEHLEMPPAADPAIGQMTPPPVADPCEVPVGQPGYPTFLPEGQVPVPTHPHSVFRGDDARLPAAVSRRTLRRGQRPTVGTLPRPRGRSRRVRLSRPRSCPDASCSHRGADRRRTVRVRRDPSDSHRRSRWPGTGAHRDSALA